MAKADLRIDWATHAAAKYACENWHYSQCVPAGKLVKIGVWEGNEFAGVVIFGRGTCNHLAHKYGADNITACELVRVALRSHTTPVSRIVAIALKMLKRSFQSLKIVISFASQDEGHHGGIYQAGNWIYSGLTGKKDEFLFRGKRTTDRVVSQFVKDTKTPRRHLEKSGVLKRLTTQQKHRYLMPLDAEMRERIIPLSKPYPKRAKDQEPALPAGLGGETPTRTLQTFGAAP